MKARILIAEDAPAIRHGLQATLESEGYAVVAAADGAQAAKLFPQEKYDLVILDVMMPRLSGYDACREIRARDTRVPVMFLTAKGEEIDKVVGFKLGADDYVTKPFGVQELLARVETLLRRARERNAAEAGGATGTHSAASGQVEAVFHLGVVAVDRKKFMVTAHGRTAALTARELKLLEMFAARRGEVLARDTLLSAVWGTGYSGTTRTLDQHVAQLRKKTEADPENPRLLVTVHGVGYKCES
jgi:DNA-binding response OmpR family regulator